MIDLGEKIRKLRQRDKRTQDDLARELGVSAQAVSRWEKGICYPDMELLPSIANYFNTSIDELFGYDNERAVRLESLVNRINEMNRQNNGIDLNIDECIRLGREALIEFPGNEKLTLVLADALFNAGYVRHGEYHLEDEEGFDIYDVEKHRNYTEWQEAMKLFEKVLPALQNGEDKNMAINRLSQLYRNLGEHEKAEKLADNSADLNNSKPFLRINANDGKIAVKASQEALLNTVSSTAELIQSIVFSDRNMSPECAAEMLGNALKIFDLVCTENDHGIYSRLLAHISMLRSYYLWLSNDKDQAFEALDNSLAFAREYEETRKGSMHKHASPLFRYVDINPKDLTDDLVRKELPESWPWWSVPEQEKVKAEMMKDPRWDKWVKLTQD